MEYEPVINEEIDVLMNELDKLKSKMFMLQMCDHWSRDDYEYSNELHKKILDIREQLKEHYGLEVE